MSKETQGEIELADVAKVKGSYKTVFEAPITLTPCMGQLLPIKEKGVIKKEKWHLHIHQDDYGNVKTHQVCSNKETL